MRILALCILNRSVVGNVPQGFAYVFLNTSPSEAVGVASFANRATRIIINNSVTAMDDGTVVHSGNVTPNNDSIIIVSYTSLFTRLSLNISMIYYIYGYIE